MPRARTRGPNIYKALGERIRLARLSRGITGLEIGSKLGISEQQVLKYERGEARIPLDRLVTIAELTEMQLPFFLEGFDPEEGLTLNGASELVRSTVDLVSTWQKVPTQQRTHLLAMIRDAARK